MGDVAVPQDADHVFDGGFVHAVIVPQADGELIGYRLGLETFHVAQHHEAVAAPLVREGGRLRPRVQFRNDVQEDVMQPPGPFSNGRGGRENQHVYQWLGAQVDQVVEMLVSVGYVRNEFRLGHRLRASEMSKNDTDMS